MVKRKRIEIDEAGTEPKSKYTGNSETLEDVPGHVVMPSSVSAAEAQLRKVMDDFIRVYEALDQSDDASVKPNYSYSEMVFLAILRSPNFCLPITEIYKYITCRFSFFRSSAREHWKNAVRHSLSKTKCFTKISVGRGVSVTGRLHKATYLWCIVPSSIVNFARGDYRPSIDKESGTNTLQWGYYRVNAGQFWGQVAIYLEKKMELFRKTISDSKTPGKIFESQICQIPVKTEKENNHGNFFNPEKISPILEQKVQESTDKSFTKNKHSIKQMLDMNKTENSECGIKTGHDSGISMYQSTYSDLNELSNTETPPELAFSLSPMNSMDHLSLNSAYSSFMSCTDTSRNELEKPATPDLPDLRDVSPFSLSPILPTGMENDSLIGVMPSISPPYPRSLLPQSVTPPYSTAPGSMTPYTAPPMSYYHSSPYPSYFAQYNPYPVTFDSSPHYAPGSDMQYPLLVHQLHGNDPILSSAGDFSF